MGDHLVLVGSILIGGILLLSIVSFNSSVAFRGLDQTMDTMVRDELQRVTDIIQHDFRKIAYPSLPPATAITSMTDSSIVFTGDITQDGTPETVAYFVGDKTSSSHTQNPYDRALYRTINGGTALPISYAVTKFHLGAYDANGDSTTNMAIVDCIEITLDIAGGMLPLEKENYISPEGKDQLKYYTCSWQTMISPSNLLLDN